MRTKRTIAALMLAVLLAQGCANQSPLTQVYFGRQLYTATLDTLANLREAGNIDDEQYRQIEVARVIAAASLDEAEALAGNGDNIGAGFKLRVFNSAIDRLLRAKLDAQKASVQ